MDEIQVFDDFLLPEELQYIQDVTLKSDGWSFGHTSREDVPGIPFWNIPLSEDSFFTRHLIKKIEKVTKKKFVIDNVYANGQTYGQDGDYHRDATSDCPGKEKYYTFLIYVSDITPENVYVCGGHTIFKDNEKIKVVEPFQCRAVLFDSEILHVGMSPSRRYKDLRVTIAYKLREENENTGDRYWV